MAKVIVDPSNFSQYVHFPKGVYRATFTGNKVKVSKNSGNEYIQWTLTVKSQGPTDLNTVGKKITDRSVLTEEALFRLESILVAANNSHLPKGEFETAELIAQIVPQVMGKDVMITIEDDPQNPERSVVTGYKPVQG